MVNLRLYSAFALFFIVAAVLFVWFFSQLPMDSPKQAIDWKDFYLNLLTGSKSLTKATGLTTHLGY